MTAITHNLQQGTPEWHAHRAAHLNASDAAAMLGLSNYRTREQLLRERASGIMPEVDAGAQARFDRGHEYEAQARPWAEALLADELYPVTMSRVVDGLPLSASMDGLTLDGSIAWEHKTLSARIGRLLADGEVPNDYRPQLEQILLVSGAERVLFMASAGNREAMQFAWYESIPALRQQLIQGWQQFQSDLAAYQPSAPEIAPSAEPIGQLPALLVEIEGRVVSTNLERFESAARALIGGIKTELETDQDFANAEATVKYCKDAEDRLDLVKRQALAQTASIDDVFRVMDGLKEQLRTTRLSLDKQVKARKEQIRVEIVTEFRAQLAKHVRECNRVLGAEWIATPPPAELADAIKGRKSIASCREVLFAKVAELKAGISTTTATLGRNRDALRTDAGDMFTLFPDFAAVGTRSPEEFDALAELRIRRHRDEEEKAAAVKAERDAAEAAKAEANRQAQIAAMQAQLEANRAAAAAVLANPPAAEPTPDITAPDLAETLSRMHTALTADKEEPAPAYEPFNGDIDDITLFLKQRDFGAEHSRIRSILWEFVKFASSRAIKYAHQGKEAA